jgi:CO/xanthine dehydrogenase FAD-binding subunit
MAHPVAHAPVRAGMSVVVARGLDEAIDALERRPDAQILAGGTDFMVEVNYGQRRPEAVVALNRVPELKGWQHTNSMLRLGAGLTYTEMADPELASFLPALRDAARTVGSPQIRNAGTIGGNLGTASPAGDTLPVLSALDASVVLSSGRRLPLDQFITGPKRTARDPGEVITAVEVPVLRGPQAYLKVGTRNAMVIAVCALALVVDVEGERVRCALGSVGPVPIRAHEAEDFISGEIDWSSLGVPPGVAARFGQLVAAASRPIDDHRSTADYRRHAVGVLARRALLRSLGEAS